MKYVLVQTTYSPQKEMVVELYLAGDLWTWQHSTRLSDARIWDDLDTIADFVEDEKINDYRIVHIKEKDLFKAKLKGI